MRIPSPLASIAFEEPYSVQHLLPGGKSRCKSKDAVFVAQSARSLGESFFYAASRFPGGSTNRPPALSRVLPRRSSLRCVAPDFTSANVNPNGTIHFGSVSNFDCTPGPPRIPRSRTHNDSRVSISGACISRRRRRCGAARRP